MTNDQQIFLLGPCAAETYNQVMTTAKLLHEQLDGDHLFIYRAGVWKPRTSPDSFQGVGAEALSWLAEVKQTYHLPVATEVATPEHVRLSLQAGIDYLWIGARTSANPIAVQSIADQLKASSQKPTAVLVKNPVNEDAALWLGNLARIEAAGVPVIAVHRGCQHRPCWAMAHAVRTARPDIPMLLDPSHMSGDAQVVPTLLQKVSALALDGAMVEVHCSPESALSDSQQQIRPEQFAQWLASNDKRPTTNDQTLAWYRSEIDELDDRLWDILLQRLRVCEQIGEWKHAHNIQPLQPERFRQIMDQRTSWGTEHDISPETVSAILSAIHSESLRRQ